MWETKKKKKAIQRIQCIYMKINVNKAEREPWNPQTIMFSIFGM